MSHSDLVSDINRCSEWILPYWNNQSPGTFDEFHVGCSDEAIVLAWIFPVQTVANFLCQNSLKNRMMCISLNNINYCRVVKTLLNSIVSKTHQ